MGSPLMRKSFCNLIMQSFLKILSAQQKTTFLSVTSGQEIWQTSSKKWFISCDKIWNFSTIGGFLGIPMYHILLFFLLFPTCLDRTPAKDYHLFRKRH